MKIVTREVVTHHVDEINLTADEWDAQRRRGDNLCRREHLAKILNLRVKKLAPQCDAFEFYRLLSRFTREMNFGSHDTVVAVTEQVYNVRMTFDEECAA